MEKKTLTTKQARSLYILRRRRRNLNNRLRFRVGSESSLLHDKEEQESITEILNLIAENFIEVDSDGNPLKHTREAS